MLSDILLTVSDNHDTNVATIKMCPEKTAAR